MSNIQVLAYPTFNLSNTLTLLTCQGAAVTLEQISLFYFYLSHDLISPFRSLWSPDINSKNNALGLTMLTNIRQRYWMILPWPLSLFWWIFKPSSSSSSSSSSSFYIFLFVHFMSCMLPPTYSALTESLSFPELNWDPWVVLLPRHINSSGLAQVFTVNSLQIAPVPHVGGPTRRLSFTFARNCAVGHAAASAGFLDVNSAFDSSQWCCLADSVALPVEFLSPPGHGISPPFLPYKSLIDP